MFIIIQCFSVATIYEALSVGSEFLKTWKNNNDRKEEYSKLHQDMKKWVEECKITIKHEEPVSPYNGLKSWLDTIHID